jgi:hypothetical protein
MDGGKPTPVCRPAHLSSDLEPDDAVLMSSRVSRLGIFVASAVTFACALPAVASATDYCVGSNTSCAPADHRDKFQNALNDAAAAPDPDRILLGAETYKAGTGAGYVYNAPTSPVEIIGAGVGKTLLTGPAGADYILQLFGGTASSVSDLTVHAPSNVAFGFDGIDTSNTARRIEVTEEDGQANNFRNGLYLRDGGTLEDSTVTMGSSGYHTAAVFLDGGHVRGSILSGPFAATVNSGSIDRSRLFGRELGIYAYAGASTVTSSYIYAGEGDGILAESYSGFAFSSVAADAVTIVSGSPGTAGARASTDPDPGWGAEITLTNAILRGFTNALDASAPGQGDARVTASYSDYDPTGNSTSSAHAFISERNVSNVGDAAFVNAAGGDYHLLPGSPLIDAGDPAAAQGLDLDGNPLVTDGNGDGTARRDIGAFEAAAEPGGGRPGGPRGPYTQAPLITGFRATPSLFAIGRASTPRAARTHHGTRFRYTLSERAKVSLKIQRRLRGRHARYRTVARLTRSGKAGVNLTRFTGRIGKRALRPGRYRARITAIDAAANRSAPRTTRFRIAR